MPVKQQAHPNHKAAANQQASQLATSKPTTLEQTGVARLIQRANHAPFPLTPHEVLQLQRTIGNQAVGRLRARMVQHRPAALAQRAFEESEEFASNVHATSSLGGIKNVLAEDEDFAWAMAAKDLIVRFDVGDVATEEEAWGTTELLLGEMDLASAALRNPAGVAALLKNPQRLTVRIVLDENMLANQGQTFVALAHEIGTHLAPRLKFIRKAVEKGGITEEELALLLAGVTQEHENVFHPPFGQGKMPQNPTYLSLVWAFSQLIEAEDQRKAFLQLYYADVKRYDPEKETEHEVIRSLVRHRLAQAQAQKILTFLRIGAAGLVAIIAIIVALIYFT